MKNFAELIFAIFAKIAKINSAKINSARINSAKINYFRVFIIMFIYLILLNGNRLRGSKKNQNPKFPPARLFDPARLFNSDKFSPRHAYLIRHAYLFSSSFPPGTLIWYGTFIWYTRVDHKMSFWSVFSVNFQLIVYFILPLAKCKDLSKKGYVEPKSKKMGSDPCFKKNVLDHKIVFFDQFFLTCFMKWLCFTC